MNETCVNVDIIIELFFSVILCKIYIIVEISSYILKSSFGTTINYTTMSTYMYLT